MELSFWAATDVGKKRETNEDNFLVDKKLSLFVVADAFSATARSKIEAAGGTAQLLVPPSGPLEALIVLDEPTPSEPEAPAPETPAAAAAPVAKAARPRRPRADPDPAQE